MAGCGVSHDGSSKDQLVLQILPDDMSTPPIVCADTCSMFSFPPASAGTGISVWIVVKIHYCQFPEGPGHLH